MDVIAERVFGLAPNDTAVVARIGKPFTSEGRPMETWCPYQIDGIGSGKLRYSIGIDGVQAISLALMRIGAELYSSEEFKAGRLTFQGVRNLDMPVPEFLADLIPTR